MDANVYKKIIESVGTPVFVYSEEALKRNINRVCRACFGAGLGSQLDIYVPYFTNSNPHLFRILTQEGLGVNLQTVEELHQLTGFGLKGVDIRVSPSVLSDEDLTFFLNKGMFVNVSSLEELELALKRTNKIGLRLDLSPEQDQRMGLKLSELDLVRRSYKGRVYGIHTYLGTGSSLEKLIDHAEAVFKVYTTYFLRVREINLGGGFAFDYETKEESEKHFPWSKYFYSLRELTTKRRIPESVRISIEPGRDIFADVGEFVVGMNRICRKPLDRLLRVYTDGSYVYMPSATIRNRQHQLKFLDVRFKEVKEINGYGELSGCTTLSNDYLFPGVVKVPNRLSEEDYVVILDIGAYGACQHLEFLNRRPAPGVLVKENGEVELIEKRGSYLDKVRYVPKRPRQLRWKQIATI